MKSPDKENRRRIIVNELGDVWFFAYGSLMWNTGFTPAEIREATLKGWHRRFCVSSIIYRGTPEQPGLSLGLDRGSECRGLALRIAERDRDEVFAYLADREMPEEIYSCQRVMITIGDESVVAYTFVVNRDHALYVAEMSLEDMARRISRGRGKNGLNRDYLASTVEHLEQLGMPDANLAEILTHVERLG
ncbi:MAG: gamma-glutamylcyclotransferase [Rhodospirillaceae bacterium]|nr:gamma-glutamylcyclotransferase [Rhodospirillaceae bacterium]|tara:strand:+ start:6666 stop:7235 length:570 start_codon:yes stop_codon:yes gene_type:complete